MYFFFKFCVKIVWLVNFAKTPYGDGTAFPSSIDNIWTLLCCLGHDRSVQCCTVYHTNCTRHAHTHTYEKFFQTTAEVAAAERAALLHAAGRKWWFYMHTTTTQEPSRHSVWPVWLHGITSTGDSYLMNRLLQAIMRAVKHHLASSYDTDIQLIRTF